LPEGHIVSEQDPIREGLAALSQFFVADCTVGETLQRVVDLSAGAIGRVDFAGLTMPVEGEPVTPVFSDPEAPDIDSAQYEANSGPCLDAYRLGEVFAIEDTETEQRWPHFCAAAAEHGVRSTLSLPLAVAGEHLGALNMYSSTAGPFSDADRGTGTAFATQAAVVLANAQAYWDARSMAEGLQAAMEHRAVIEQAKGLIMAAMPQPSPDAAFDILTRASQRENRKLRDIAAEIIANKTYRPIPSADIEE